jgi:phage-related protein (TIGR01555 family)
MVKTVSRVRAANREARRPIPKRSTSDSFQNFASRVGMGTENQHSFSGYGFNPITRNRQLLDFAYRGSWLVRACVDAIAEDMAREGIEFTSGVEADDASALYTANNRLQLWDRLTEVLKWSRLYGGAGLYIVISGQKSDTPLRIETVGKGQFVRLVVLDRWMLNPSINQIVSDPEDVDAGHPEYYDVIADAPIASRQRIHHSRFIRFEGLDIPYWQRLGENFWSLSVLEPLYDRITTFDSTSLGAAQLAYKAHLRTYSVKDLRKLIAAGGKRLEALFEQIAMVRMFQTNEGLTLIDAEDTFQTFQYSFAGLSDLILQFAQQVSGAEQIPLVRLFGQSPAGLNATGDSDWRNYYDGIKRRQESTLRMSVEKLMRLQAQSQNIKIEEDFQFEFVPLWQLDHTQRAAAAQQITGTVQQAFEGGMVNRGTALKELKQASSYTGIWTSITSEEIEEAENEPPLSAQGGGEMPPGLQLPGSGNEPSENEEGEPSQAFLPGMEPGQQGEPGEDAFLPVRGFLPGHKRDENDSGGAFFQGETERRDWRNKKPLVHLHLADQDLPGRNTQFSGFPVVIEVEKGQPRFEGSSGGAIMAAPYGYFPGTVGNDGDCVDVFLGDNVASQSVYIIDQCVPETREFHQHKVFLGFDRSPEVADVFIKFYADGKGGQRLLRGKQLTLPEFRNWLEQYRAKAA